jgi:phosphoribosylformimino-5-aminoimidazole carboxamide ribotide isomerase
MISSDFRLIPVLDLRSGQAVHAVGGNRENYGLLRSRLSTGSDPREIARGYREALGLSSLYVADLDAIGGGEAQLELLHELAVSAEDLWIDAGVRGGREASPLRRLGQVSVVAGMETLRGPDGLREVIRTVGPEPTVVSLDLFQGRSRLADPAAWRTDDPLALARRVYELGARRLLLLELSRVGTSRGPNLGDLPSRILDACPDARLAVGGGISSFAELLELQSRGIKAVLVGTALHDGRIGRAEIERLHQSNPTTPPHGVAIRTQH